MSWGRVGAVLACLAIAAPSGAAAEWTLGNGGQGGVETVYLTRSAAFAGAVAFVCDNASAALPQYIVVVTSPFNAALGRLDVTMTIGTQPPTVSTWTASPRDNSLRSRAVVVADVLAAMAGEPSLAFTAVDDFGRNYRVEAPVENLLDLAPAFLQACAALPPAPPRRF
jgi:hypothetical protein